MSKIEEKTFDNEELDKAVSALYDAALQISDKSGLSIASITGSINHTHERKLMGMLLQCRKDPKESTSIKSTEH